MSWNEKDFTRWSAQSYARLGPDVTVVYTAVDATLTPLTVPANHLYLVRAYNSQIINSSAVSQRGYAIHRRGAADMFIFSHILTAAVITTQQLSLAFPYPMPMLAGDTIFMYSSAAALAIVLSLFYTDVNLLLFPAYDPGY